MLEPKNDLRKSFHAVGHESSARWADRAWAEFFGKYGLKIK
jgi:hypothetical protein